MLSIADPTHRQLSPSYKLHFMGHFFNGIAYPTDFAVITWKARQGGPAALCRNASAIVGQAHRSLEKRQLSN